MMEGEEPLFTIEESKRQLEALIKVGVIKKEQLKGVGIRTTVIREYSERMKKDELNRATYIKIDEAIQQRYKLNNR